VKRSHRKRRPPSASYAGGLLEFTPTHKIWLAANHLPRISGTDVAVWRRIRVLPFTEVIPADERDPHLQSALREELPGILRWAIEGCIAWQTEGLATPASVKAATDAYQEESDWFTGWTGDADLSARRRPNASSPGNSNSPTGTGHSATERNPSDDRASQRNSDAAAVATSATDRRRIWRGIGRATWPLNTSRRD
jgi:hypothetical protein